MNSCTLSFNSDIKKNKKIISMYSIFIALYPVLCLYKGFSNITVGDIILIGFFLISIFKKKSISINILSVFLVFLAYVTVSFLLINLINYSSILIKITLRYGKLVFYIFSVVFVSRDFIDTTIFKRWTTRISLLGCVYLYVQYIMYFLFHRILNGWIPWLSIYLDEYSKFNYENFYEMQFRPTSFFLEPSMFCQYIIVALIFVLFTNQNESKFKKISTIAILLSGFILSTSGQGIILAAIVLIIYLAFIMKNKVKSIVLLSIGSGVFFLLYNFSEIVYNSVSRLSVSSGAFDARVGSFDFISELKGLFFFFGYGYGTVPPNTYLVGGAYVWYGCGIIGFLLAIYMFYKIFKKASCMTGKMVTLMFFIMFFGTSLFINYMFFWYFSIALFVTNESINSKSMESSVNILDTR